MPLWEYGITKKGQIGKKVENLKLDLGFNDNKNYKIGNFKNNVIYTKKVLVNYQVYTISSLENAIKNKNTWELVL